MKQKLTLATLAVAFVFFGYSVVEACTNILVTKGASKDGSNFVSYSADSHVLYGELYSSKGRTNPTGTMKKIYEWDTGKYLGEIAEAPVTYSTIGNMNEHQVIITETTFGGLEQLQDPSAIMDYGSLIYTALQRAKTAREAIKVIVDLANEYGYYSSGESFSIADKNEVWIMELIGKGSKMVKGKNSNKGIVWVAVRIPDGAISAHANQARITSFPMNDSDNAMYAPDVISFAKENGIYTERDGKFSFSDTYAPLSFGGMRGCEARVWSVFNNTSKDMDKYLSYALGHDTSERMPLWIFPDRKLSVKDVADLMRDHYEGTVMDMTKGASAGGEETPYRWRPGTYEVDGVKYQNERAIATQQSAFWLVGQARSQFPDEIGGILWWGVDDAGTSALTPIYSSSRRVPECFEVGNGSMTSYSPTSAFWLFNRVAQFAYLRYNKVGKEARETADRFEKNAMEAVEGVDIAAMELYKKSPETARKFVEDFSVNKAMELFNTWDKLDKYLLVKYIDGNQKKEEDGKFLDNGNNRRVPASPIQSGYSEAWKRAAAKDAGEVGKVVVPKK